MPKKPRAVQGMHKEDIKAALRKRYGSMKALSHLLGVDETIIRAALFRPYPKAEALIAKALDTVPAKLWPERYTDDVMRNHRHWRRHINVLDPEFNTAGSTGVVNH